MSRVPGLLLTTVPLYLLERCLNLKKTKHIKEMQIFVKKI